MSKALKNKVKLNDTVSVKDFGAVGDGVTDDTTAIQAAINSMSSTGGRVFFPSGTYLVNSGITLKTRVTLEGADRNSTIIKAVQELSARIQVLEGL